MKGKVERKSKSDRKKERERERAKDGESRLPVSGRQHKLV